MNNRHLLTYLSLIVLTQFSAYGVYFPTNPEIEGKADSELYRLLSPGQINYRGNNTLAQQAKNFIEETKQKILNNLINKRFESRQQFIDQVNQYAGSEAINFILKNNKSIAQQYLNAYLGNQTKDSPPINPSLVNRDKVLNHLWSKWEQDLQSQVQRKQSLERWLIDQEQIKLDTRNVVTLLYVYQTNAPPASPKKDKIQEIYPDEKSMTIEEYNTYSARISQERHFRSDNCCVCFEHHEKDKKPRVTLPNCYHSLCVECLTQILKNPKPLCPMCRTPINKKHFKKVLKAKKLNPHTVWDWLKENLR